MKELYRAVYTRCFIGVDFNAKSSIGDGQKIFSTCGNMGLSRDTISLIEAEIRRDIYSAGMRSYLGDACRFFYCNGISVLLQYRWLNQNETGGKVFGLTKALIGNFEYHPLEYYSPEFFREENYFYDFPDYNGQAIRKFEQLHTFKDEKPPLFPIITQSDLFRTMEGRHAISFEQAGGYVLPSDYAIERVRAAVCHLVKQFELPENHRKGIAVKGTIDQIRHWFAAIGYAFSAKAAQKISFSIAFPPVGFPYNFSTAALVGWDIVDPDLAKLTRIPTNLVYLDDIPLADPDEYYTAITRYDDEHLVFINRFVMNSDDVLSHPSFYKDYSHYNQYKAKLQSFIDSTDNVLDLLELNRKIELYTNAQLYNKYFYRTVLKTAKKAVPQSESDIDILIEIYETLEKMITEEVIKEESSSADNLHEELKQNYIERFFEVFSSILSSEYHYCNAIEAKKPYNYFVTIVAKKEAWAFEIARLLISDDAVGRYTTSNQLLKFPALTQKSWESVIYSRLSFVNDMMIWHQLCLTNDIAAFVYKSFSGILCIAKSNDILNAEELERKIQQHNSIKIFNNVFCDIAIQEVRKTTPQSYDDISKLIAIYDMLENMIINVIREEDAPSAEILLPELQKNYVDHFKNIFVSIFSNEFHFCNIDMADNMKVFFSFIEQKNHVWAYDIAQYLIRDDIVDKYEFSSQLDKSYSFSQYSEKVVYPRISFISFLMNKYQKAMTDGISRYVCKALNATALSKNSLNMSLIYNSVFLPFNNENNNDDKGNKYIVTTYLDCGFIPQNIENHKFKELLERVFLHDFENQLNIIGNKKGKIESRMEEAHQYIMKCKEEGLSEDTIFLLYKESFNVSDEQSMFYYQHSFSFFPKSYNLALYEYSIDKLIEKITLDRFNEKNDEYYLSAATDLLKIMKQGETPEMRDALTWEQSCKKVDARLERVFFLSHREWDEKCTSNKSQIKDTAMYIVGCGLFLPNSDRINLYCWLKTFEAYNDQILNIAYTLREYVEKSIGFKKCDSNYKNGLLRIIKSKRWTGEIYRLILHLFEFEDYVSFEIINSLSNGLTVINNDDNDENDEFAFCELCSEMYNAYISDTSNELYIKFLSQIKKAYPTLSKNRKNKWGGWFYLLLMHLFEQDEEFSKTVLETMVNEKAVSDASVFCDFCIILNDSYRQHKKNPILDSIWKLTEEFCHEYKILRYKPLYKDIYGELGEIAKRNPSINSIRKWLEPIVEGDSDGRGIKLFNFKKK